MRLVNYECCQGDTEQVSQVNLLTSPCSPSLLSTSSPSTSIRQPSSHESANDTRSVCEILRSAVTRAAKSFLKRSLPTRGLLSWTFEARYLSPQRRGMQCGKRTRDEDV